MRKIVPTYTEEEFLKLKRHELHQIWFHEALTDRQIAKLYNTTKEVVKQRRKELGITVINSAMLFLTCGSLYQDDRTEEKRRINAQKKYEKQLKKEQKFRGN